MKGNLSALNRLLVNWFLRKIKLTTKILNSFALPVLMRGLPSTCNRIQTLNDAIPISKSPVLSSVPHSFFDCRSRHWSTDCQLRPFDHISLDDGIEKAKLDSDQEYGTSNLAPPPDQRDDSSFAVKTTTASSTKGNWCEYAHIIIVKPPPPRAAAPDSWTETWKRQDSKHPLSYPMWPNWGS